MATGIEDRRGSPSKRDYAFSGDDHLLLPALALCSAWSSAAIASITLLISSNTTGLPRSDANRSARGPVLTEDYLLFEKMAQFNRERIPQRVAHAKGAGAHAHVHRYRRHRQIHQRQTLPPDWQKDRCIGRLLHRGPRKGLSRYRPRPRGFSIKFYTEEGNWDRTGNNRLSPDSLSTRGFRCCPAYTLVAD
jgi:hypothetical protein